MANDSSNTPANSATETPLAGEFALTQRYGNILVITINRPESYNALHPPANFALANIFDEFAKDDDLWVAIITGSGDKAFCSGNDLKYQASGKNMTMPDTGMGGLTSRFDMHKPIIAAVNGLALGGGFEVALSCDLIIAAEHARFGLPEAKVGLFPATGGVQILREQVPRKIANEILLTAKQISAAEALEFRLINKVVAADQLMQSAFELATEICQSSPKAIQATKQLLNEIGEENGDAKKMALSTPAIIALTKTEDFREGITAFVEKRSPNWKNK
ncbi:enoyl-CoA hydratase-related protein [Alphaproteobacteria bacterium]|jgi:enoyl-CoA hydratase/carnithine racemase|nr:enoyl-CoA hydratase-related protein [Alphaproteobacteria bacterium]